MKKLHYTEALDVWNNIQTLPAKEKYKQLKALAYCIGPSDNPNIEEIDFISMIYRKVINIKGFPGTLTTTLNQLNLLRLKTMGIDPNSIKINLKKNIKMTIDTATIGFGDQQWQGKKYYDKIDELVKQGHRIFFSTGADGTYHVQIRIIDAPFPVLSVKEYRRIGESSNIYYLKINSGKLTLTDYLGEQACIDITPGNYKVCIYVYSLHNKEFSYYICLAKSEKFQSNKVSNDVIPVLQE